MAKAFSVASWNVEHFKDDSSRIKRVVKFLDDPAPDAGRMMGPFRDCGGPR